MLIAATIAIRYRILLTNRDSEISLCKNINNNSNDVFLARWHLEHVLFLWHIALF